MWKNWVERKENNALDIANLIAGFCLFVAPWVLAFTATGAAAWNAWIVGAVVALVALGALVAFSAWEEWVNLVLGAWDFVAPWVLGFTAVTGAFAIHLIVGALVAILAAVRLWLVHNRPLSTV
jgi:hypothetical protein